jgi:hypothetical protein
MKITLAAGIRIDPPVDRLMADAHPPIVGIIDFQTTCDGLRRPVETKPGSDAGDESLMLSAPVPWSMASFFRVVLCGIIPVYRVVCIGGPVPSDLTANARMVPSQSAPDFSLRKTGDRHMSDDILLFWSKMMVGHDGLLSGSSVGGTSLYQKTLSCPLVICHVVHLK